MATNTVMKALAALQGKYEWFTLSTGGQFTPNPLTKEQWLATAFGPPRERRRHERPAL